MTLLIACCASAFWLSLPQDTPQSTRRVLPAGALAGEAPGTWQFLVQLRARSFDPQNLLTQIRKQPDRATRQAMYAHMSQVAADDQADVRAVVESTSGRWRKSFWCANVCAAELTAAGKAALLQNPRVLRLWPLDARVPSDLCVTPGPIGDCVGPVLHAADDAKNNAIVPTLDPARIAGAGITVGFFDSGLDFDAHPTGQPHPCFGTPSSGSRLLASILVPGSMPGVCPQTIYAIDCNTTSSTPPVHPFAYQFLGAWVPLTHRDARHGTAMAAVALGYQVPYGSSAANGHAHDSFAVGWAITRGGPTVNSCPPRWTTDSATLLAAVEALRAWNQEAWASGVPDHVVRVLNVSFDGWSDAMHPVEVALDELATCDDVLVVTSAGNDADATINSHAFHNGLSVGAVRKRESSAAAYEPAWFTSRGPLFGDKKRFYPDVCGVGASSAAVANSAPEVPHVDPDWISQTWGVSKSFRTEGTSLAAPQVAGAAALYMARSLGNQRTASALETKAAILASVSDPYALLPVASEHTYRNRNAYGVGFVRDDFLCEFAERHGAARLANRLGATLASNQELWTLTPTQSNRDITWSGLAAGQQCVVAIAWHRNPGFGPDGNPGDIANVDLEVWDTALAARLARSVLPRNSYERCAFVVPVGQSSVVIRLVGTDLLGDNATVFVAARKHPEAHARPYSTAGTMTEVQQPVCILNNRADERVDRTVPSTYAQAYGSVAFFPNAPYAYSPWTQLSKSHTIYGAAVIGGGFTARAMAFRSWRPSAQPGPFTVYLAGLAHVSGAVTNPADPTTTTFGATYPNGVVVASNYTVNLPPAPPPPAPAAHKAMDWYSWQVRIPFATAFTYDPAHADGSSLALWWEANYWITIDGLRDGGTGPYWTRTGPLVATQGDAPIIGFATGTLLDRPRLLLLGEPILEDTLSFQAVHFGPWSSGHDIYLLLGLGNPNAPFPPGSCLMQLSDGSLLPGGASMAWSAAQGHGALHWSVPLKSATIPDLLHRDLWAQAVDRDSGGLVHQATQGIRLQVGGRVQ